MVHNICVVIQEMFELGISRFSGGNARGVYVQCKAVDSLYAKPVEKHI
jgi:hypothetical protein